jgi:hypothetical protein
MYAVIVFVAPLEAVFDVTFGLEVVAATFGAGKAGLAFGGFAGGLAFSVLLGA